MTTQLQTTQAQTKKNWFQVKDIPFKKIGAVVGSFAAAGSLIGLLIGVNKWFDERPNLDLEINQIDLVGYLPEASEKVISEKMITVLINLENQYVDITGDHVNNIIRDTYDFLINSNRVFVKYPEAGANSRNYLELLQESFEVNIAALESDAENASDDDESRYEVLIATLKEEQEEIKELETPLKISMTVRVENSSRLSNYMNSQAVLLLHRNEQEYSSVPKIILDLVEEGDVDNSGKVEGYGVSSITFESEVEVLEQDSQHDVDIAFKKRPEGDEDYTLMFVLEDIKGKPWHEQALFSAFTEQNKKDELRVKAESVFDNRER